MSPKRNRPGSRTIPSAWHGDAFDALFGLDCQCCEALAVLNTTFNKDFIFDWTRLEVFSTHEVRFALGGSINFPFGFYVSRLRAAIVFPD